MLSITNLHVSIDTKPVLHGVNLEVHPGEVVALMGPNGSGKSTLAYAMAGHPRYQIHPAKQSTVICDGQTVLDKRPDERAKLGLFLAFQHPLMIEGVTVYAFLRQTYQLLYPKPALPLFEFKTMVKTSAQKLGISEDMLQRSLNDGFSGGEKKRLEILQMRLLHPKYVIVDEIDAGLDVDALKAVALMIREAVDQEKVGALVITHSQRILEYLKPTTVHILSKGKIIQTGGPELAQQIEDQGYTHLR